MCVEVCRRVTRNHPLMPLRFHTAETLAPHAATEPWEFSVTALGPVSNNFGILEEVTWIVSWLGRTRIAQRARPSTASGSPAIRKVRRLGRRAVGTSWPGSASMVASPIPRTPGVSQADRFVTSGACIRHIVS